MPDQLHGFNRDDLECIAEGLEKGYEPTVNVGNTTGEGDEHLESTTAAAARFIRAALAWDVAMRPTYYVRHPNGSVSIAEPQPTPEQIASQPAVFAQCDQKHGGSVCEDPHCHRAHAVQGGAEKKIPRHKFWGAGEPDCPQELKASNGELHTMRCKVCGDGWRRSSDVCLATLGIPEGCTPAAKEADDVR